MLLSRVAEHLYWAARYVERAEDTARVVAEHTHLLVDLPTSVPLTWEPLLAVTGQRAEFRTQHTRPPTSISIVTFLLADRDNPSSVVSSVVAARENLRTTREVAPPRGVAGAQRPLPLRHEPPHRGASTGAAAAASSTR